jgi:hypothetical protein
LARRAFAQPLRASAPAFGAGVNGFFFGHGEILLHLYTALSIFLGAFLQLLHQNHAAPPLDLQLGVHWPLGRSIYWVF